LLALSGCDPNTPWNAYPASDPRLQFIGRGDPTLGEGLTYAYSGGTVRFRFKGTGLDVAFNENGSGDERHTQYVNIVVDGVTAAVIKLRNGAYHYKVARNLPPGEHIVELVKRTDTFVGPIQFLAVSIQGELLEPPPPPEKRLEVIGDSLTCGYGNEVSILAPTYTEPNTGFHSINEDVSKAYGSLLGRELGMDVVTTCIPGAGLYRDRLGQTNATLPALYKYVLPDMGAPVWDSQRYVPDVIVINLGTNDFGVWNPALPPEPPEAGFKKAYTDFIQRLRALYPEAVIVCAVGPMMNDYYPPGRKHWTLIQQWVSSMVADVRTSGDVNVHYFAHAPLEGPYGEDWHPSAKGHEKMAQELTVFLRDLGF
jgi:lysophospholipase L1-like esterase